MSITWRLRKWAEDNRTRLYMGGLDPYEVGTIADEIDATHKQLNDKAHADGEKSAMKQVRSKSVDYRKGYEQAMKDVERTMNERKTNDERTKTEHDGVITDELRESMSPCISDGWLTITKSAFEKVADRIDERYEQSKRNLTDALHQQEEATFKLSEKSVLLPVDADGVPININDKIDGYGQMHRVHQLRLYTGRDWALVDEHGDVYYNMAGFTHVQPDSWEHIIEDACDMAFLCDDDVAGKAELVKRCKRLAGETE